MISVCFYFQVHQPFRIRQDYSFFRIGRDHDYFDDELNREIIQRVAQKCYLPANAILLEQVQRHHGRFRVSFSISGAALDQFERYAPEVIDSFRKLVDTRCVELINETYYHSLAFLFSREEFEKQVLLHRRRLKELFDYEPTCFRNTELIYNNKLAHAVEAMGYSAILAEGAKQILGWRTPNYVYQPTGAERLKLLLRNYQLSDDLAFRFADQNHDQYPITAKKYAGWLREIAANGEVANVFIDYETFGEHQWTETGIFDFLTELSDSVLQQPNVYFQTPSEIARTFQPMSRIDVPYFISWADVERDLTAWVGNPMQDAALEDLYEMQTAIEQSGDQELQLDWRRLQTSDHFYYMCTKWFSDGAVHHYFNPYQSPHDAFVTYCNVLNDLRRRVGLTGKPKQSRQRDAS